VLVLSCSVAATQRCVFVRRFQAALNGWHKKPQKASASDGLNVLNSSVLRFCYSHWNGTENS
jgi:hypothetical protein